MMLKIILALCTFLFSYLSILSEKGKKVWIFLPFFAILSLIFSIILIVQDEEESEEQQSKIIELLHNTKVANDSITGLKTDVNSLENKLDSNQVTNDEIKRATVPVFEERILFTEEKEANLYFNGILEEGTKIRVTRNNCSNNLSIMTDEKKPVVIHGNLGTWETVLTNTSGKNEAFLRYQGGAPCGLTLEIYLPSKTKFPDNKISLITEEPEFDNNLANYATCVLENIGEKLGGSWLLKMKYKKCNGDKQSWGDNLVVFFKVNKFRHTEENGYEIDGYSYAEEINDTYKSYLKSYKIHEKNGYLFNENKKGDCYIMIQYKDDTGYIKLINVEYIEGRTFLYGVFYNYNGECEGEVEMINIT